MSEKDKLVETQSKRERSQQRETLRQNAISLEENFIVQAHIEILSMEELKAISVVQVTNPKEEGPNSVNDPKMGVVTHGITCDTCRGDLLTCEGHLGRIEFGTMIYHPLLMRKVIAVLRCICYSCGGLLILSENPSFRGILSVPRERRLTALETISMTLHCSRKQPEMPGTEVINCGNNLSYEVEKSKENKEITYKKSGDDGYAFISIDVVYKLLRSITNQDAQTMGFESSDSITRMIMRGIPVIETRSRAPSYYNGSSHLNPISAKYINIIKKVDDMTYPKNDENRESARKKLIIAVEEIIINKNVNECFKHLIQGKYALVRNALMAKRVDYSARTVISPDPDLEFGWLTIPKAMVSNELNSSGERQRKPIDDRKTNKFQPSIMFNNSLLTVPVTITPYNYNRMLERLAQGKITHIISRDEVETFDEDSGNIITEKKADEFGVRRVVIVGKTYILKIGDQVERLLEDGDIAYFNRQPSLHKQSFMAHSIKISQDEQLSVGLHPSETTPYNADHDGDEGNIHIPQSIMSQVEASIIGSVVHCVHSGQTNSPIMGLIQDVLDGCRRLTMDTTVLSGEDFLQCLAQMSPPDIPYSSKSGRDAMRSQTVYNLIRQRTYGIPASMRGLSPEEVEEYKAYVETNEFGYWGDRFYERATKYGVPTPNADGMFPGKSLFSAMLLPTINYSKAGVVIVDGILTKGEITKAHIGVSSGSLIEYLLFTHGEYAVIDFITNVPRVISEWMNIHPMSTSLCNFRIPEAKGMIQRELIKARYRVEALGTRVNDPLFDEWKENQIKAIYAQFSDIETGDLKKKAEEEQKRIKSGQEKVINEFPKTLADVLKPDNSFVGMTALGSGAKGDKTVILQSSFLLGQQRLRKNRLPKTLAGNTRFLPYETIDQCGDQGLCTSSFYDGLTPPEFYSHHAASREGTQDQQVKIVMAGSINNTISSAFMDLTSHYDNSVRSSGGYVYQTVYGADSFDPEKLFKIKSPKGDDTMTSFINLKDIANGINSKYGYSGYADKNGKFVPYNIN